MKMDMERVCLCWLEAGKPASQPANHLIDHVVAMHAGAQAGARTHDDDEGGRWQLLRAVHQRHVLLPAAAAAAAASWRWCVWFFILWTCA